MIFLTISSNVIRTRDAQRADQSPPADCYPLHKDWNTSTGILAKQRKGNLLFLIPKAVSKWQASHIMLLFQSSQEVTDLASWREMWASDSCPYPHINFRIRRHIAQPVLEKGRINKFIAPPCLLAVYLHLSNSKQTASSQAASIWPLQYTKISDY